MELVRLENTLTRQNNAIMSSFTVMIETMRLRSEASAVNYDSRIRTFFREVKGKELEELSFSDLKITKPTIKQYQVDLFNKGLKSITVSVRLSAMKKFYKALEEDGIDVSPSIFDIELINNNDGRHHDTLSIEEVQMIAEYVATKRLGDQKTLLVELAFATGFRLDSLLNMTKDNFFKQDSMYLVKVKGKRNKYDTKQLEESLYNKALSLSPDHSIFSLNQRTVGRMMADIRDHFDFGKRHIVFHSFKSASINYRGEVTDYDIKAMQRQGNHTNVSTTLNNYAKDYDLEDLTPIDIHTVVDTDVINQASHEELLKAIDSLDEKTKRRIARFLSQDK